MRLKTDMKRLADIALAGLVLMGSLSLAWAGLRGTAYSSPVLDVFAEETELARPAVVIDAGHGGFDGGAVGTNTGVREAELNLAVARFLEGELRAMGFGVIMTRESEDAVGETKGADMENRRLVMRDERADIVVSIHMNKFGDSSVSGPMVFYMRGSEAGKALADCVVWSLCESLGRSPRPSNPEDLFVLRVPEAPSVLVECGFLSNPGDEALLITPAHQKKLAKAIASGIAEYFAGAGLWDKGRLTS